MTSLFAALGSRTKLPKVSAVTAAELEQKLHEATAALPELERLHATAALNAECQVDGAGDALMRAVEALQNGQERVKSLTAALRAQRELEAIRDAAAREKVYQSQVAAVRTPAPERRHRRTDCGQACRHW